MISMGYFILILSIVQIESHPRHHNEHHNNDQSNDNKLLTDYSDEVQDYLKQFGYLDISSSNRKHEKSSKLTLETANLRSEDQLRDAIRKLQKYAGLPETGHIDAKTRMLLKTPRCGVPDFDNRDYNINQFRNRLRIKRFVAHETMKWDHHNITWSFVNQTMTTMDANRIRRIFHDALNVWSKNSQLNFQEVYSPDADIQVMFAKRHHGDGYDFDGPGNVLAHAFYPAAGRGGDAHFDEEEPWHLDDRTIESHGTSLKNVAVHEFGHSLGLGHSSVQGALMFPWYHGFRGDSDLPEDDRLAIQSLYGVRDGAKQWGPNPRRHHYTQPTTRTTTTTTWRPPIRRYYPDRRAQEPRRTYNDYPRNPERPRYYPSEVTTSTTTIRPTQTHHRHHHHHHHNNNSPEPQKPKTCDTSYDAITIIRGVIFIFKGRYLWRIDDNGVVPGYPHEITKMWRELPRDLTHIDSVYENKKRQIVFFVGNQYYVFHSSTLLPDYPKPLTSLGLPEHLEKINAAFVWGHNNRTYFFSGQNYWRFDEDEMQVELDYPRNVKAIWKGLPNDIDSAFQYKDGKTYFFKDKGYWQFDDIRMKVKHESRKRSSTQWMGSTCKRGRLTDEHLTVKSSKLREEEFDDIDTYDEVIEEEFDFENVSHISKASHLALSNIKFTILFAIFTLRIRIYF